MKTIALISALIMMAQIPCVTPIFEETIEPTEVVEVVEVVQPETITPTEEVEVEPVIEPEPEPEKITFRVTAYCSCYECCGKWALNRPRDENGHEIVRGASGKRLVANYSCASPYPFGTKIEVDGLGTFEVHDRTAQWVVDKYGDNIIDVYVDNHEDIKKIGRQFLEGVIVND